MISRLVDQGVEPVDIGGEQILLTLAQPANNHNGGNIAFGPDGYLYIGFGDGGGSNDQFGNGQNTQTLHGSLLRLDVSGASISIPPDNPFVADPNVRDEIYAYGLRNPWRFSFEAQTGELWLGDVGQGLWEEIDNVAAGDNLGWPIMEGNSCFGAANCDTTGLTLPITDYDHANGACSVTGGFVDRGQLSPAFHGLYFYADFCNGQIFSLRQQVDSNYLAQALLLSGMNIGSFAQGLDGEVLVLNYAGGAGEGVYRIVEMN